MITKQIADAFSHSIALLPYPLASSGSWFLRFYALQGLVATTWRARTLLLKNVNVKDWLHNANISVRVFIVRPIDVWDAVGVISPLVYPTHSFRNMSPTDNVCDSSSASRLRRAMCIAHECASFRPSCFSRIWEIPLKYITLSGSRRKKLSDMLDVPALRIRYRLAHL